MEFKIYKCTGILHQEILQNINFVNIVFIVLGECERLHINLAVGPTDNSLCPHCKRLSIFSIYGLLNVHERAVRLQWKAKHPIIYLWTTWRNKQKPNNCQVIKLNFEGWSTMYFTRGKPQRAAERATATKQGSLSESHKVELKIARNCGWHRLASCQESCGESRASHGRVRVTKRDIATVARRSKQRQSHNCLLRAIDYLHQRQRILSFAVLWGWKMLWIKRRWGWTEDISPRNLGWLLLS